MCDFEYDDGGKCAIPDDRMHAQHFRLVGSEYADYVDNARYTPPPPPGIKRTPRAEAERELKKLADQIPGTPKMEPIRGNFAAAVEASEVAADRWSEPQKQAVLAAIRTVAEREPMFTTDAVWAELGPDFPVTKGMTAMLQRAKKDGVITSTDQTVISRRGGEHDHAQRLTVWQSLVRQPVAAGLRDFG